MNKYIIIAVVIAVLVGGYLLFSQNNTQIVSEDVAETESAPAVDTTNVTEESIVAELDRLVREEEEIENTLKSLSERSF